MSRRLTTETAPSEYLLSDSPVRKDGRFLAPPATSVLSDLAAGDLVGKVIGCPASARCIQRRHRNEVFEVNEEYILKVYTRHGEEKLARKLEAHRILQKHCLPVPKLVAHGRLSSFGVPWTLEKKLELGPSQHVHRDQYGRHVAMGNCLRQLHRLPAPRCVAGGWMSDESYSDYTSRTFAAALAKARASAAARAARGDSIRVDRIEDTMSAGSSIFPDEVKRSFIHGGFSSANGSAQPEGETWQLRALFDFEDAHPGDPAEDFALVALYGLREERLRGLIDGYVDSCNDDSDIAGRILFWTSILALGVLEWGPRLGDIKYTRRARTFLDGSPS